MIVIGIILILLMMALIWIIHRNNEVLIMCMRNIDNLLIYINDDMNKLIKHASDPIELPWNIAKFPQQKVEEIDINERLNRIMANLAIKEE